MATTIAALAAVGAISAGVACTTIPVDRGRGRPGAADTVTPVAARSAPVATSAVSVASPGGAPSLSTRSPSVPVVGGDPPPLPVLGASVERARSLCPAGSRSAFTLHPARVLRGCCDERCVAHVVDAAGAPGPPLPWHLGLPAAAPEDAVHVLDGAWPTEAWLAIEQVRTAAPPRVSVLEHARGRWTTRYATRADSWNVRESVIGMGRWPGGAVLVAVHAGSEMFPSGQRIEVVRGRPSQPVPQLPDPEVHRMTGFVALETGHAFGTAAAGDRLVLLRWTPGAPQPVVEVRADVEPLPGIAPQQTGMLAVASPAEVYVAGIVRVRGETAVGVLRFDGEAWTSSARLPGSNPTALASTPDRAVWIVTRGRSGGLWRRAPGPDDRWARVAAPTVGHGAIEGSGLLPCGQRDVVLLGHSDEGAALHRVHLDVTTP